MRTVKLKSPFRNGKSKRFLNDRLRVMFGQCTLNLDPAKSPSPVESQVIDFVNILS